MHEPPRPPRAALIAGVAFEAALVLVAYGLGALLGVKPLATLRLDAANAAYGLAAAAPMLALFVLLLARPVGPLRAVRDALDAHLLPVFRDATILDVVAVAGLAGVGEEMLFRGVLQGALGESWGPAAGLVLASAAFGLVHFVTPGYALLAAVFGAWLGWLWHASGNLLVPVVAHAAYDFAALALYLRDARRRGAGTKR